MTKRTIRRFFAVSALLALAACNRDMGPYPSYYMAQPAPPPLQPYVEPLAAPRSAVTVRRTVRRHYVRHRRYHHYRREVRCPCLPNQPIR